MKIFKGRVIHTKMAKTAVVAVERNIAHPTYGKRLRRIKKYIVHDGVGVKPGQLVHFAASRPISKLKRFRIVEGGKNDTAKK